jgi:hypothetical protein
MSDINVTVTNAGTSNVTASSSSTYTATVGNGGVVNVAIGMISPGNATVVAGSLTINSTSTLSYGNAAYARNVGTAYAASLDIGIPAGPPTAVLVGNTTTLSSGNASVTGAANGSNLTLSFAIPRGASGLNGTTPSFAVGNVTTLAAGGTATVTATSANNGANVVLNFAIPRGVDGTGGGSSNLTVSDATPSNLGVASAGTSNLASRSDHTHNLPVIAYANLTGVPSNFPSNIGSVSGLQSALDGKQAAGNYLTTAVTGVNNLTGNLSLIAAGGLSIAANGSTLTLTASADVGNSTIDGGDYVGQLLYGITFGTQPQSVTAIASNNSAATANFTVSATAIGGASVNYQWQSSSDAGSTWSSINNATSATLSLSNLTTANSGVRYRAAASSTGAVTAYSQSALLTVYVPDTSSGVASSPFSITNTANFVQQQFVANINGSLHITYNITFPNTGTNSLIFSRKRDSGEQLAISIDGNGTQTGSDNYSDFGSQMFILACPFAAGDIIKVFSSGSVNIQSLSLWIA